MLAEARLGSAAPWTLSTTTPPSSSTGDLNIPSMQQRQGAVKHQHLASTQRSCFSGLEMKSELVWKDWDLQREFTKTLVLKNINSKLQKLHVRPPATRFFTTSVTQMIVLSPGTSFSVPVTFKPLQKCVYEDSIELQGKDGSFQVQLRATLPCHALELPSSVQLPLCAVQHSTHISFPLRNVSKLQTSFQWACTAPFELTPKQGLLKPGQQCLIMVDFQPQEAVMYQQQVCCWYGEENKEESCYTVILKGGAKYPYLQVRNPAVDKKDQRDPVLDFGPVAVGKSMQKYFDIFNASLVPASFSVSRLTDGVPLLGSEFSCGVTTHTVAPHGSVQATVSFTPAVVDTVSVEYISLSCRGALTEPLLKLTGSCVGPDVSLSSSVVDFGCVDEGREVVRKVELVNSSPAEAVYQWDLDCSGHSVFSIQPVCGTLSPYSHATLTVVYRPMQPMVHKRRVECLILHREPIFLNLIGTCHSELQKPTILKPEHVGQLKRLPASATKQNKSEQQGVLCPLEESPAGVVRTPMEEHDQSCLESTDPLACSSASSCPLISVLPTELLFLHKASSPLSSSFQSVSIHNLTLDKLRVVWTSGQASPFSVSPSSSDLAPLKSTAFRVTYEPQQLNTMHAAQLECFAYCKDTQHTEEQLQQPPWCVTVRAVACSSSQADRELFIPRCSLRPPQVVFPALGVLSCRTVLLQNDGDSPLTYCWDHSSDPAMAESLSVVPSCALIQPGSHQILTLRTTPSEDSPKQGRSVQLQLNASEHTKELTVVSVVEKLRVSLEGDGNLYFHPTALGSQTRRSHQIRNLSRLPLRFQWSIPEADQELISVEPDVGELHPNESSVQIWSFTPLEEQTYTLNPTLTFWPVQTPGCNTSQLILEVVGMGAKAFLEAEKAVLDIGDIVVGTCRAFDVPLVNNSLCPVTFSLSVQQTVLDVDSADHPETAPCALHLDCETGTAASHTTMLLQSTIRPRRRAQYLWNISYQTLDLRGSPLTAPQQVCEVRAKGVFPTLEVIDVCGRGSVEALSKAHLWKLFSLDSLNTHLQDSPSTAELTYRTPTRHSLRSRPSIFTKVMLDFNFSAAPLNSDPSTFVLMFHNPCSIPVNWAFLFPEDQQIELEYWAESGEFSNTELYQMKVQDNHVFSISPRSGTLLPGQKRAVQFSYRHAFAATDRFPVVFKLSDGREILLIFQGVTMERDRSYLHFASRRHVFTPVSLGDRTPPKQLYELHNGGAVPVRYQVDVAALSQLQADNFNHPVLCCLNPEGELPAGRTTTLEWIFSPLEAKMYHMDVSVHVRDGESTVVSFEGRGLMSPALDSKETLSCSHTKAPQSSVQRQPFPGQVVLLSEDSVSFGDVPVLSQSSRILVLNNVSQKDTVHYTWEQPSIQQVVQIHPARGRLRPGESAPCVLTFTSSDYPTCYQLDVICQVIQETALTQYREALQRWEEERKRQQDEFIITDKNPPESPRLLIDKVAASAKKGPPLRKYTTLPSICPSGTYEAVGAICSKLTRAERRAQRDAFRVSGRPESPRPVLLHLGIRARSHTLTEYLTRFPDQRHKHLRCLESLQPQEPETTSSLQAPERDITTHILTSLLSDILGDSDFTRSLITMEFKPVTYQLRDASGPSHSPSPPSSLPQRHPVDSEGTAGRSGDAPQARTPPHTDYAPVSLCEEVLLNTIQNVMMEAVRDELELTAQDCTGLLAPASSSQDLIRREQPVSPAQRL